MSSFGRTLVVRGELRSDADLTIEGRVEGPVWCEGAAVTLAESASVIGDVMARDVTVTGRLEGQIVATEVVDVRAGANVTGKVVSARFILNEGATFNGRVEPQHLEAAVRVARFQREKQAAAKPADRDKVSQSSKR
jgi:cytoskeletal protein CcmA (bactofilin family)